MRDYYKVGDLVMPTLEGRQVNEGSPDAERMNTPGIVTLVHDVHLEPGAPMHGQVLTVRHPNLSYEVAWNSDLLVKLNSEE
tara:strand:+ start:89 stop:331 length:243 start_codon:yes stop_codon:yes gene_type:complete